MSLAVFALNGTCGIFFGRPASSALVASIIDNNGGIGAREGLFIVPSFLFLSWLLPRIEREKRPHLLRPRSEGRS